MTVFRCLLALALSLTLVAPTAAEQFYKWVDEEGVTHYTKQPPQGGQAEQVKIYGSPGGSRATASNSRPSAPTNTGDGDVSKEEAAAANDENFKDPEVCEWARKNLETLRNHSRIRVKDQDSGEMRILSPEEIAEKTAEAEQAAAENCP